MNAPLPPRAIWTTSSTAAIKTGTWRAALARHVHAPSPCHAACPVHGDIAEWIGQARERDFAAAWQTLSRHNPFPAVIGRVCHHPCEAACNRAGYDEPLSICKLERCVGDIAIERGWAYAPPVEERVERVAVVGGGPSGLSAAYQLRRRGYRVTLFEAQAELGGVMRYGIPAYRLARAVLDAEIARIVALGIDVRCGEAMATPQKLAELRAGCDAVYLAYGAGLPKRLPQLDYREPWAIDGADYLRLSRADAAPRLGRRVLVVGGGSAALDVARSARRAGHEVTLLALEAEAAMPAQREEVVEAREEGIALVGGAMLCSVEQTGAGLRLQCVRVRFAPGCAPVPLDAGEFTLEADAIVSAIGQDPDFAPLSGVCEAHGALLPIDAQGATGAPGVWAGGDLASGARFVSEAIGMGERAALAIDRHLRAHGDASAGDPLPLVALNEINLHYHPPLPRAAESRVAVAQRLAHGGEVQLGLAIEQALAEAARCFSCGTCTHCDNCITYCPDLAVQRAGDGYSVLTDYCKGCGVCVRECPTGSMAMLEELR